MSRCPACGIDPGECECGVGDSSCITVDGAGTAANPLTFTPVLDPDPRNLLTCTPDGLLTTIPTLLTQGPAGYRYRTANFTVPRDVPTIIPFNVTAYVAGVTASGNGFIVTTPGIYLVTMNVVWTGQHFSAVSYTAEIMVAGNVVGRETRRAPNLDNATNNVSAQQYIPAGGSILGRVTLSGVASEAVVAGGRLPSLSVLYLRGAP